METSSPSSSVLTRPGLAPETEPIEARAARAFEAARAQVAARRLESWRERDDRLKRFKDAIQKRMGRLHEALAADLRKPEFESLSSETTFTLMEINHARSHLPKWTRRRRVPSPGFLKGSSSEVWREPKGCVLIIAPWNYPFQLAASPAVAALAAGNSVVIKPSELTPSVSRATAELVAEAFAPDECSVVEGGTEASQALMRLPFDHAFFTGGERGGRAVMAAAAERLMPVTLELGGKSPAIVGPGADLDYAARRLAWAKFLNMGQTCVAPDFVVVERSREAELAAAIARALLSFYGQDPKRSPDLGRIVNRAHFERLSKTLDAALAEPGVRLACGGARDLSDLWLEPTVVAGAGFDSALMKEEIFGPILPLVPVDSLDEAEREIAGRPKPLALYAFGDEAWARGVLKRLPSGGACVNNAVVHLANPHLPFGGTGASGFGAYHGERGFQEFSHERSVFVQGPLGLTASRLMEPPIKPWAEAAMKWAGRWLG